MNKEDDPVKITLIFF